MKILDVLIALVVIAIVGTIGYGVYATVIKPVGPEPTNPPITAQGARVDYNSENCPLSLSFPNTWGANEEDGGKTITITSSGSNIVINCAAEEKKGDISAKSYKIETLSIGGEDYTRYLFFSDDASIEFVGGYIVPDDKNLSSSETDGFKYTGDLFITVGEVKYLITYDFGDAKRATDEEGAKKFDEDLKQMDTIVESIEFE